MTITKIEGTQETKQRVAAYARVSTLMEEQEESFETQCEYYTKLIKSNDAWEFAGLYADHGKSGLSASKRPDFMRMIGDAKEGKIDIILCKSISRFGRNFAETQEYLHELRENNVEVRFEREGITSFDPSTNLILQFMSAIAQAESESISQNVRWTYEKNAARGIRRIGNNHILGYDDVNGVMTPNEDAWIPMLIFTEYAEGISLSEICRHLNEKGAKRLRSKKPYEPAILYTILRNEAYMGDRLIQKGVPTKLKKPDESISYNSYYIEDDHEPIVSKEIWKQAEERLEREKGEIKSGLYLRNSNNPLYGRLFCGECGQPLKRRTIYYHGTLQKVWKCRGRIKGNGCRNDVIADADILAKLPEGNDNVYVYKGGVVGPLMEQTG